MVSFIISLLKQTVQWEAFSTSLSLLLQIEQFFPQLRDEFQGLILRRLHVLLHSFYCI